MSDREEFERAFPVPEGIEWISDDQGYRITSDDDYWFEPEGMGHLMAYIGQWTGWQAARESEPAWTNRLNTCKHHGDDHEACAVYGGRVPCDSEGGEAVAWPCWSCKAVVSMNERSEADGDCPKCGAELDLDLWPAPQPDNWIPEGWKLVPEFSHSDMDVAAHDTGIVDRFEAEKVWEVMVAAAPTPPEQESE